MSTFRHAQEFLFSQIFKIQPSNINSIQYPFHLLETKNTNATISEEKESLAPGQRNSLMDLFFKNCV